jgi:hypothetical protein
LDLQDWSAAAQGNYFEYQIRVRADGDDIFFSPRSLLEAGRRFEHNITVEWFALHAHVIFASTIAATSMTSQQQQEQLNPR